MTQTERCYSTSETKMSKVPLLSLLFLNTYFMLERCALRAMFITVKNKNGCDQNFQGNSIAALSKYQKG